MTFEKWLQEHGSTGVFVKTKARDGDDGTSTWSGGGRVFMARGEVAPFRSVTISKAIKSGSVIKDGNRLTLAKGAAQS